MKIKDVLNSLQSRQRNLTRLCVLSTIFILTFSVLGLASHNARAASPPAFTFTNYEIARSWDQSFAGVSCPNTGSNCWNWTGEPHLATAPDGTIYAVSDNTASTHPT